MDYVAFPPAHVRHQSPDGHHLLTLDAIDDWRSRRASASLYRQDGDSVRLLWQQVLPHEFGPRYSLVGDGGQVVLIDESINVASRRAVMVIDRHGTVVAVHGFDAVLATLGVPAAVLAQAASSGSLWVAAAPILDPAAACVRVPAADRWLGIELDSGRLHSLPR